jgi:hypothetical protein
MTPSGLTPRGLLLLIAGCFSFLSVCLSSWLIRQHQLNMTRFSVQSKVVGIIWMIPIYSVDSFLSLLFPSVSLYIDMLRDCYEVRNCDGRLAYSISWSCILCGNCHQFSSSLYC